MKKQNYKLAATFFSFFVVLCFFSSSCSYHQRNSHQLVKVSKVDAQRNHDSNALYSQQAYGGIYQQDFQLSEYVQFLGQKIVRQQNLEPKDFYFTIVNTSIPNIWSFPKGQVAITRGLLTELHNEAELVAVLAHEIAHLTHSHGISSVEEVQLNAGPVRLEVIESATNRDGIIGALGSGAGLITLKYDLDSEIEADSSSMVQISEMGYSTKGFSDFNERIFNYHKSENKNWTGGFLAKHPISEERILFSRNSQSDQSLLGATEAKNYHDKIANLKLQNKAYQKLDDGYRAFLNKDYVLASQIADEALDLEPTEAHFYILKGKALAKLGYILDALQAFNRAIDINPKYFDAYLQRGLVKEQLDDFVQASQDLQASLMLLPTAEAYYALGEIDYQQNQEQAAIQNFRKASFSSSLAGRKAVAKLKELGLALSGLETLEISPIFSEEGYINLKILNRGIKPLKNLIVDIDHIDATGSLIYRHFLELHENLNPQTSVCHKTNIGPFFNEEHMNKSTIIKPVYFE